MARYQLRLSHGLKLRDWIHQLAMELDEQIPQDAWSHLYPNKGIRVVVLTKALRAAFLPRVAAFDTCGTQNQCDEACESVGRNHNQERSVESGGSIQVERYQVAARNPMDLARALVDQILKRLAFVPTDLGKHLLRFLTDRISDHLYTNELCGFTELCSLSSPRNMTVELARDPNAVAV